MKLLVPVIILTFLLFIFRSFNVYSDSNKIVAYRVSESMQIDGELTESVWNEHNFTAGFWQHYPIDTLPSVAPTEVLICYDERYIYIAAKCFEKSSRPVVQTLKRDDINKFWISDGFSVVIEPINNDKYGFFFGLNANGAKVEGTVSQSASQPSLDINWNNNWEAESAVTENGYFYEMAIPFSSIKYNADNRNWGINFIRNDMKRNVYDLWTRFPVNYSGIDLGYNGTVEFQNEIPNKNSQKLELTPALSGSVVRDYEENEPGHFHIQGGIDAKMAIGTGLNLDLSIYPDFSTVEVDQQYIDFQQYEYYMPEQRAFFLENSDLFSNFGTYEDFLFPPYGYRIKPIYTRRIGIVDWEYMPMIYGVRLSGNASDKLRIGMLNVQTDKFEEEPAQNFSAVTFQQSVLKRSAVKGIFTNRQSTSGFEIKNTDYNRTAGLEFDYLSQDGKWSVLGKAHTSFNPEKYRDNYFLGGGMAYTSKKFNMQNWVNSVGRNYVADMGYVPRLYHENEIEDTTYRIGYKEFVNAMQFVNYPGNEKINIRAPYTRTSLIFHDDGDLNEVQQELGYYMEFSDKSLIYGGILYNHVNLLYPFDLLDNDKPIAPGKYNNIRYLAMWNSNPTGAYFLSVYTDYARFYGGNQNSVILNAEYKIQPRFSLNVSYHISNLKYNKEIGSELFHLLGVRSEVGFTRSLFWTNLVQLNTQENNVNINSLLQWRFRPLSDFYVVVKDDMTSRGLDQKKFQVVFKMNYWFKI